MEKNFGPLKQFTVFLLLGLSLTMSQFAHSGDVANGKKLYDKGCNGCHDTRVHTRPNRIVHTYEDLLNRVKFCDNAAKSGFNDQQIMDVTDYLNDAFYKFIKD